MNSFIFLFKAAQHSCRIIYLHIRHCTCPHCTCPHCDIDCDTIHCAALIVMKIWLFQSYGIPNDPYLLTISFKPSGVHKLQELLFKIQKHKVMSNLFCIGHEKEILIVHALKKSATISLFPFMNLCDMSERWLPGAPSPRVLATQHGGVEITPRSLGASQN